MKATHALTAENVLNYFNSPRANRRKGARVTVVNDATGNHFTFRFRRPVNKATGQEFTCVLVDLMTGTDNESSYSFIGTLRGDYVAVSPKAKTSKERADKAALVLNWTIKAAQGGDLKTVRCLHFGTCGRCGRTLSTPESVDQGLGPECVKHS